MQVAREVKPELPKSLAHLRGICAVLLAKDSTPDQIRDALDRFAAICDEVGGIQPDPGFDAWAGDTFLADGVAIAPQAAAHCVRDYHRTLTFIRGVYAAMETLRLRFPGQILNILYAGCGPYATLLLPLLSQYDFKELDICLLDIHRQSLDSVTLLLKHFGLASPAISTVQGDACTYVHPCPLHLVISETMQKSLEQEPQLAVTAHLAPQLCAGGIFIPEKIQVRLGLEATNDGPEKKPKPGRACDQAPGNRAGHYHLGDVLTLTAQLAVPLVQTAVFQQERSQWELQPVVVEIPALDNLQGFSAALFTRIQVYDQYWLDDHETEITLPQHCTDIDLLKAGECWEISYQLGAYPRFDIRRRIRE